MAKTMFVFFTRCKDPSREKELSDWYDNIHIPDVLTVPGVISCIRFRISDQQLVDDAPRLTFDAGLPTYLSIVESRDDISVATARLREGIAQWQAAGRMSDLYEMISMATVTHVNPPLAPQSDH